MEKLLIIDPYNNSQVQKIKQYEEEQALGNEISLSLINISTSFSEEEYQKSKNETNTIEDYIAILEGDRIKDLYLIQGEKDRKTCQLSVIGKLKKRKALLSIIEYILNRLKMIEVFIKINSEEKETIKYLNSQGYENLGEEQGNIIFLKEKTEKGIKEETNYETTR